MDDGEALVSEDDYRVHTESYPRHRIVVDVGDYTFHEVEEKRWR